MTLARAPLTEAENSQFFRPTQKDRMAFSARLLSMGTSGDSRNRTRYFFSDIRYPTALASLLPPAAWTLSARQRILSAEVSALFAASQSVPPGDILQTAVPGHNES